MSSRIRIGALPSGTYGVRISEAGYDVSTQPPDNERLIFSSEWTEALPVYQLGSFTHRTTGQQGSQVTQTVSFTSLGFVPFVDFIVRGNGDAVPAGSDLFPNLQYYDRSSVSRVKYWDQVISGDSNAYLRCNISTSEIRIESFVRNLSGQTQGFPRTWTVYYVIYRAMAY